MKRCPKCDRAYPDENQNFCLIDGSPLVETGSEPTVVIPHPARSTVTQVPMQTTRSGKGKALTYLAIAVGVIFLLFLGMMLALFLSYGRNSSVDLNVNSSNSGPTKPSPTPTHKPSPSPSPSASPSPAANSPAKTDDESSAEVVPIAWDTVASGFKGEPGKIYKFECPANGTDHAIYGNDVYADYSSICTAAVHAGVITLESGGTVTLEYKPGRQIYGSTERNGIKSSTASENGRSFVVR